jgi:glycopeptide antibiotics resistance protein
MINMSLTTLYMFSLPLVLVVAVAGRLMFRWSRRSLIVGSLFTLYLLSVLKFTILPMPQPELVEDMRAVTSGGPLRVNFKPLWLAEHFIFLAEEQVLNILLFVPFGILFSFFVRARPGKVLLGGLVASIAIETLQLVLCLVIRYPYRVIDVNDVIYNFTGACFGFALFKIGTFAGRKLAGSMKAAPP